MSWIITASNKKLDYRKPDPDQIIIEDIATGLSNMPRFAGQIKQFYSVAEHCILAERQYVQSVSVKSIRLPDKEICKAILMHDATEAYMCDIPTPLKRLLPDYQFFETLLDTTIKIKFDISMAESVQEIVRAYDALMLKNEALYDRGELLWLKQEKYKNIPIIKNFVLSYMPPQLARDVFLKRWEELK